MRALKKYSGENEHMGSIYTVELPKASMRHEKIRKVCLNSEFRGLPNTTKEHKMKSSGKSGAPAKQLGKGCLETKKESLDTFHFPAGALKMPAPSSTKSEVRHFVIDSGISMHMSSNKDLSSGQLDFHEIQNPITVVTANGCVHDFHRPIGSSTTFFI